MASAVAQPSDRIIPLDGLPQAILAISCVFLGLSICTVALRTYTRIKRATFGLDDAFVVIGTVSRSCSMWKTLLI